MDPTSTPRETHLYTSQEVHLLFHDQMILSIEPSLGILFAGGVLTLGTICAFLLSSKGKEASKQQRFLRIYVIVLSVIVLACQVVAFLVVNYLAFTPPHGRLDIAYVLTIMRDLSPVVVAGLTDGLLVWRCFMVQKSLGPNCTKLQKLFWIIPASLWGVTMTTGFTGGGLICLRHCLDLSWCATSSTVLQSIAITSNVILNLFATSYIVIRLLLHRRALVARYGHQVSTVQHLCIAGILLESAAINVPATISLLVSINVNMRADVVSLAVTCQAFASVLIIHQVAIGRAFGRHETRNSGKTSERRVSTLGRTPSRSDEMDLQRP